MINTRELLNDITDEIIEAQVDKPIDRREIFNILAKHILPIVRERNSLLSYIRGTIVHNSANFIKGYEEVNNEGINSKS